MMSRSVCLLLAHCAGLVQLSDCHGTSDRRPDVKRRFISTVTQCVGGPCGPSHQQCGPPTLKGPQFHITDDTCDINDPNGVFYDETHGVYHVFYQDHLAMGIGVGPVWGHVASRNLVEWTRLPVALWNDRPYDADMLWSGSATMVDGRPVLVYPGGSISPPYPLPGFMISAAVPANSSDPLYTNWSKPETNPLYNQTQRDPSTAWKTSSGEWRMVTYGNDMYGSMDFKKWKLNGKAPFNTGECPSLFPLPSLYPGSKKRPGNGTLPSHVLKTSIEGWTRDMMQFGTYEDGPPGTTGKWTPLPGQTPDNSLIDFGDFYASKDLYDSSKGRRINIGWVPLPPATSTHSVSALSLPRHLTWHPGLQQIMHSPVEEQVALRGKQLVDNRSMHMGTNDSVWLGDWSSKEGAQSEIVMKLARPSASTVFGVDVMAGNIQKGSEGNHSTRIFMQFVAGKDSVQIGVTSGDSNLPLISNGPRSSLKLLATDTEIELRVFVDHTFVEVYWMDGRVAMTSRLLGACQGVAGMRVFNAAGEVAVQSLDVWFVNSIWVSPEHVLNTPRVGLAGAPASVYI